jgi:hypothetical protein
VLRLFSLYLDLSRLAALPTRGLIITARRSGDVDLVSRFFASAVGIDEDPVTGWLIARSLNIGKHGSVSGSCKPASFPCVEAGFRCAWIGAGLSDR